MINTYEPTIELAMPAQSQNQMPCPPGFREAFRNFVSGIYPTETIEALQDGYNPLILGYDHVPSTLEATISKLEQLKGDMPGLSLMHEIYPEALGLINDFVETERNYLETRPGIDRPQDERIEILNMARYRSGLEARHSGAIALWGLKKQIEVQSIEHPDCNKWVSEAVSRYGEEENFAGSGSPVAPFYAAIKRDIYGLERLNKIRPDIIAAGGYHALKYDMLLGRDGQKTTYFLAHPLNWSEILNYSRIAHSDFTADCLRAGLDQH